MADQDEIKRILDDANKTYRQSGESSQLTDDEYDFLLEQVEDEAFKARIGTEVERSKVELKVTMGSLNKIKSLGEIQDWIKSKKLDKNWQVALTPKFDGLSLLVEFENGVYKSAATRGDGTTGQDVSEHLKMNVLANCQIEDFSGHIVGEVIMAEDTFAEKYANDFKNPRNMVAGLLSRKKLSGALADLNFLAFSVHGKKFATTKAELEFCNEHVNHLYNYQLPIELVALKDLKDEALQELFEREKRFQCDGLVVEINDCALQENIGNETNSLNPAFARAWKPESDNTRSANVKNVRWQISKSGLLKPVVEIEPVDLAGVTISNVTGINARFIEENKIATGAAVTIIRSGDVIPKITNVIVPAHGQLLPESCPCCDGELAWNENRVELVCHSATCGEKNISQITDFFTIMGIDEVGEGIVKQFFDAGYTTLAQILNLSLNEMELLEGFQQRKAKKVFDNIEQGLKDVSLAQVQHASNLFKGLGKRKLEPVTYCDDASKKPGIEELLRIDGFSDITARSYLKGFDPFWQWLAELPITVKPYEAPTEGELTGKGFVFTGFRSPEMQALIESHGGKMVTSVSKKTYALVMKKKGSGSSKEKKAEAAGVRIMDQAELEDFLAGLDKKESSQPFLF